MKNLISEIAKLLNIDIGKEFYIKTNEFYWKHKFTNNDILVFDEEMNIWRSGWYNLPILIMGEYEIIYPNETTVK